MNRLGISVTLLVALAACLAVATMIERERVPLPAADRSTLPEAVARFPAPAATGGNDAPVEVAGPSVKVTASAAPPLIGQAAVAATGSSARESGWITTLYPELARIARLEEADPGSALHDLAPLLTNEDPVVRLAALESAADINHAARLPALLATLDDPAAQIRVAALEALMLHGDPVASATIESYVYDPDPAVRAAAVEALAVLGNPASIPVLAGLLYDGDRRVRIDAVTALGEIGGSEAIGYLRPLRHDPDDSIRISANAILAEEADLDAFQYPPLEKTGSAR